jgi:hypothetical protein
MDDINSKIGKLLKLNFETKYLVMDADEEGYFIDFDYWNQADIWLSQKGQLKMYSGAHIAERHYYPQYDNNLESARIIVNKMAEYGFWLKLTSPFAPKEEDKPVNPKYIDQWQNTRFNWYASFDFHGTTDSRPLWSAGSPNPANAVIMAALECIEGNNQLFSNPPMWKNILEPF